MGGAAARRRPARPQHRATSTTRRLTRLGCPPADAPRSPRRPPKYTGVQDYDDYPESGTLLRPRRARRAVRGVARVPGPDGPRAAAVRRPPAWTSRATSRSATTTASCRATRTRSRPFDAIATGCIKPIVARSRHGPGRALTGDAAAAPTRPRRCSSRPTRDRAPVTKPQYRRARFGRRRHGFAHVDAAELQASARRRQLLLVLAAPAACASSRSTRSPRAGIVGLGSEGNVDDPQFQWLERGARGRRPPPTSSWSSSATTRPSSLTTDAAATRWRAAATTPTTPPTPAATWTRARRRRCTAATTSSPRCSHHPARDRLGGRPLARQRRPAYYAQAAAAGFWVVRTSAEADWPHQDRLIELMDNRDGTLSLFGTLLDNAAPAQRPAARARGAPPSRRRSSPRSRARSATTTRRRTAARWASPRTATSSCCMPDPRRAPPPAVAAPPRAGRAADARCASAYARRCAARGAARGPPRTRAPAGARACA